MLVETYHPEHYAIALAARQDYLAFYEKELHYRRMMHYPPFAALASILVRDARLENAVKWSREIERFFAGVARRARSLHAKGNSAEGRDGRCGSAEPDVIRDYPVIEIGAGRKQSTNIASATTDHTTRRAPSGCQGSMSGG